MDLSKLILLEYTELVSVTPVQDEKPDDLNTCVTRWLWTEIFEDVTFALTHTQTQTELINVRTHTRSEINVVPQHNSTDH